MRSCARRSTPAANTPWIRKTTASCTAGASTTSMAITGKFSGWTRTRFSKETTMTLTERLIGELGQESDATRRVLERVPEDNLSWKPHAKSMSLGQLALHVAMIPGRIADLVSEPEREIPNVPRPEAKSVEELTSTLSASVAHASEKLRGWGDEGLDVGLRLSRKGTSVLQM